MRTNNFKVTDDLKVILDATPEEIGKRTIKHVYQCLKVKIYAFQSGGTIREVLHLGW